MYYAPWMPGSIAVLTSVLEERVRQEDRYGDVNDELLDGTGHAACWLLPYTDDTATEVEATLRKEYDETPGLPTWAFLVREELAEAFKEPASSKELEEELVQVAALCVSWVERIRARR